MKSPSKKRILANLTFILVYSLSALVGIVIMAVSVWGDVEASFFDASIRGEKSIGSLNCPILITSGELGEVTAKFSNPIARPIKSSVRVHISNGFLTLMSEENEKFDLAPNESKKLAWVIEPQDAAYGKMILVKVYLFPNHPLPSRQGTCGIFVLNIPQISGKQILIACLAISLLGMVSSTAVWKINNHPMSKRSTETYRALTILFVVIGIGTFSSLFGWWLLGAICLIISILLSFGAITQTTK